MIKSLNPLLKAVSGDKDVIAAILFGSAARGEKFRDIDIALVINPKKDSLSMSKKRLSYLKDFPEFDIQIFNQLPLYVRQIVLKEGKVLFSKDDNALYDIAFETIRAFEDFKPYYEGYVGVAAHV